MKKIIKHIIAILVFIPITTMFIISVFFEMIWLILHLFHYEMYSKERLEAYIDVVSDRIPLPIVEKIIQNFGWLLYITYFIDTFLRFIFGFFIRLGQINEYKF